MCLCSFKGSDRFLTLRVVLSLTLTPASRSLSSVWLNLEDLSEWTLPLCSLCEAKNQLPWGLQPRTGRLLCLHSLQFSRIGHLGSCTSRRPGTEQNESDLRTNPSALCFPLALCFISAVVMLLVCCPPASSMLGNLQRTEAQANTCPYCHRVKDALFAEGKLFKNAFKSKSACAYVGFVITVGQLVLYQCGRHEKKMGLFAQSSLC